MKAGFTGTREGMTQQQKYEVAEIFRRMKVTELHHGDCVGADRDAHLIAAWKRFDLGIVIHPPKIKTNRAFCGNTISDTILPPKNYIKRNHDIVDDTDFLIATPKEFNGQLRSGTWATIRYARKQDKKIHIVYPNGRVMQINTKKFRKE